MNAPQTHGSIIITGGGTGGHLYPAIAVAEAVRALAPQAPLLFIGREAERDRREVEARGIPFMGLPLQGLRRRLTLSNIKALWLALSGLLRCIARLRSMPRGAVFGVGGYVSAPAMAAAKLLGWKTALHEQNTVPGLVNRMMANWCDRVFLTYESTKERLKSASCVVSGFPLRKELIQARNAQAAVRPDEAPLVLSIGGSQGARRLVEASLEAFRLLRERGCIFRAALQTGPRNIDWALGQPAVDGVELVSYIDDMAARYNAASIAVSRAGSGSLSELALWGLPSILVPYPYAAGNHQAANAAVLADAGAAVAIDERELSGERLADELERLLKDDDSRAEMARRAALEGRDDAAERIARDLIDLIRG